MSSRRVVLSGGVSSVLRPLSSALCRLLLGNTDHDAGADGFAALADGKGLLLLHRDRRDQLHIHRRVVPRHDHLRPRRQRHLTGHVRGSEVKLRTIVVEERRGPGPLLPRAAARLRPAILVSAPPTPAAPHLTALPP